jgi:hypothetical protein
VAHDRHKVAFAPSLNPQHAKPVLGIVERDALDRACECLNRLAAIYLIGSDHLVHAPAQSR